MKPTEAEAKAALEAILPLAAIAGSEACGVLQKYAEKEAHVCRKHLSQVNMEDAVKHTVECSGIRGQLLVWSTLANLRAVIPQTVSQLEARLAQLRKEEPDGDE